MTTDRNKASAWIVRHYRAFGADVCFGPFPTMEAALEWAESRIDNGISGVIVPLTDPETDPRDMWRGAE